MDQEQADLLLRIAEAARPIEEMDTHNPVDNWKGDTPGCLICHAARLGIIDPVIATREGWDLAEGFSSRFGCSSKEAARVLYHNHLLQGSSITSGENYYRVVVELLAKHNHLDQTQG